MNETGSEAYFSKISLNAGNEFSNVNVIIGVELIFQVNLGGTRKRPQIRDSSTPWSFKCSSIKNNICITASTISMWLPVCFRKCFAC